MNCTFSNLVFILILLLCNFVGYSQRTYSNDEQTRPLRASLDPSLVGKIDSLITSSRKLLSNHPDSAITIAQRAYEISVSVSLHQKSALALSMLGTANLIKGEWDDAIENLKLTSSFLNKFQDTLEQAKTFNNLAIAFVNKDFTDSAVYYLTLSLEKYKLLQDSTRVITAYNNLGVSYAKINNYKLALENYQNALEWQLAYQGGSKANSTEVGYINNNIGGMYIYLGQIDDAINYFSQASEIKAVLDDKSLYSTIQTNLGISYYKKGLRDKALEQLLLSLELCQDANNHENLARAHTYIGRIYEDRELYGSALSAYRRSLTVQKNINNSDPETWVDIGRVYRKLYNLEQAEKNALEGLTQAREDKDLEAEAQASSLLSLIYEDMFQDQRALDYERRYSRLSDSINKIVANREYMEMRTLFEADRQKQELAIQKVELEKRSIQIEKRKAQSRNLWITLASVIILFFSALYSIYRVQKTNEKLVTLNTEIKHQRDLLNTQAQKLKVINEDMRKFSLALGHDLKQPLTTIKGYSGLIRKEFQKQDSRRGELFAYNLEDSIDRMNNRIQHLVEYIREGENFRKNEEVDLKDVIGQVSRDLHGSIQKHHARLNISTLPKVKGDSNLLARLFQNLISNSIKYRRDDVNPKIEIDYRPNGFYNIISVKDNGAGIKEKYLKTIFNLFDRGERKDDKEGTGIGLSTCKRIVELHGGKIEVDSTVGTGTTFYLYFPRCS